MAVKNTSFSAERFNPGFRCLRRSLLPRSLYVISVLLQLRVLCLKLESSHGLNVAFRMLDLDGNATLGRAEFQEVYDLLIFYKTMFISKTKCF